jgi:hypothetical protein
LQSDSIAPVSTRVELISDIVQQSDEAEAISNDVGASPHTPDRAGSSASKVG